MLHASPILSGIRGRYVAPVAGLVAFQEFAGLLSGYHERVQRPWCRHDATQREVRSSHIKTAPR